MREVNISNRIEITNINDIIYYKRTDNINWIYVDSRLNIFVKTR